MGAWQGKNNIVAIQAGAYGDTLHALALFIEQARAAWKEIAADPMGGVTITWEHAPQTLLAPFELEAARRVARMHRGLDPARRPRPLRQRLRAVGRLLDQIRASSFTVAVVPEGLRISAQVVEGEETRIFRASEVARLARSQLGQRAA